MDQLAELRERRALTLRELAEMSGVAADTINQIELGHRKPRPSTLRKLARALEVNVEELMPPKASAPSTPGQPEKEKSIFDLVRDAVLRQAEQDRQAFNRALESERPQTYWVRHESEAMKRLLEYNHGDLAEAYIALMWEFLTSEQERNRLTNEVEALKRRLEEVGV
jgi:HTH-type transcriptional regulator, competence development regulator